MASSKNYLNYILQQLNQLDNIHHKQMMGEYLLYYNGVLFGGIYDDRLLVKQTPLNNKYNMKEVQPYENAKLMYLVDDIDNQDKLKEIVLNTCSGLVKQTDM